MRKLLIMAASLLTTLTITTAHEKDDADFVTGFYQVLLEMRAEELKNQRVRYRVWDMLCFDLRDVDCTGLKPPTVLLFSPNPLRPGLAGYFKGDDVVYVRDNLFGDTREEVMAHEFSHYIDSQLGLLPPMPVFSRDKEGIYKLCESEKRSWAVSDAYWVAALQPQKKIGSKWTQWYSHCTPFKDRLYP